MQTAIVPVSVFPSTANTLMIRSITLGPPPSYYYELQDVQVVEKTREVENPNYHTMDGEPMDPTISPTLTETYEETVVTMLKNGNVSMTQAQWAAWPADADDDEVQLDAISENLGLTRA